MTEKLRDKVLASLDVPAFYREVEGLDLIASGSGQYSAICPFHDDNGPSLNIRERDGVFNCFAAACGATGSIYDFHIRKHNLPGSPGEKFKAALHAIAEFAGVPIPGGGESQPLLDADVISWHEVLMKNTTKLRFLHEKRGLTDETITKFKLGWDGERLTIPVYDEEGNLQNVRRYLPNSTTLKGKMLGIVGHNERRLFRPEAENEAEIILTEGELDCILAVQEGFNADTVTSGAGNWKDEFTTRFAGKRVILAYDNDDTGRRGAQVVGRALISVTPAVFVLSWPDGFKAKGDVTDYLVEFGNTAEDFAKLVAAAPVFVAIKDAKDWSYRFALSDMGNAERLINRFGTDILYVTEWGKWITWNGVVWKLDDTQTVMKRAMESVRLIVTELEEVEDEKAANALKRHALQSEAERKLAAMVAVAKTQKAISADEMDNDLWVLNTPNGVLDLRLLSGNTQEKTG